MPIPQEDINKRFEHHPPTDATKDMHVFIRHQFHQLASEVNALPDGADTRGSREKSLALTALEEALMWANAHIARNLNP